MPATLIDPGAAVGELLRSLGTASLIGGLCDLMAIKAAFKRYWDLPHSGVLPRNRDKLINGIARTLETKWLTPEMVRDKIQELDLAVEAGRFLASASLEGTLGREEFAGLCAQIGDLLRSKPFRDALESMIRAHAPASAKMAGSLGLLNFQRISADLSRHMADTMTSLPGNARGIASFIGLGRISRDREVRYMKRRRGWRFWRPTTLLLSVAAR